MKNKALATVAKLVGFLALFTAVFFVYRIFIKLEWLGGMWIYLILSCALFLAYFIVNRGLSSETTKPEDLPDTMNHIEKQAYLDGEKKRKKAAKLILVVFSAVAITLLIDLTDLYFGDTIRKIIDLWS